MNYFLNTYHAPLAFLLGFVSLAFYLVILHWSLLTLAKVLKLSDKWRNSFIAVAVFGSGLLMFVTIRFLPEYIIDGKITDVYFMKTPAQTRLIVWFTREDPENMSTSYSNRLKAFDPKTGKKLGYQDLNRRHYLNDYEIYGPFGRRAWGYGRDVGVQLLDLFQPKILVKEKEILKRNPQLGKEIRLISYNYYYNFDSATDSLRFATAKGEIYRLYPDLKAVPITRSYRAELPADKIIELYPSPLGKLRSKINLDKILKGRKEKIYTTLRYNDELLVFVTRERLSLAAFRVDPVTGKILGRIDYF